MAGTLHDLITEQAARTPDATAVLTADGRLTYRELETRTDRLAHRLRWLGVGPDTIVGLHVERSTDLAVGLLGILKAGGAFLPLDPEHPVDRVSYQLVDAGADVLVTQRNLRSGLAGVTGTLLALDEPDRWTGDASTPPPSATLPDHLCSLYYTSGSTGRPKGVASTHHGWVNRMRWMQREHPLGVGDVVLHKTTLTFDDAAVEVLWPFTVGGAVAMLAPGDHRDPQAILTAIRAFAAVHVNFVPSMLDLFLDAIEDEVGAGTGAAPPTLRSVLSSGEALRPELVARFLRIFGAGVRLDNTWGATEVSIDSTCHVCGPADAAGAGAAVSLGRPIDHNQVHVLDDGLRPVAATGEGELYIGGIGLARGYHRRPALTAERFVPDPFGPPGSRLYRTGDRGRRTVDDRLEYLGRVDNQVKIRGVRIELEEIEAVMCRQPGVTGAAVTVTMDGSGDKSLVGYVVGTADPGEVRAGLRRSLPAVMVPRRILRLPGLPRTPSGKLDRRRLPGPSDRDGPDPGPPRRPDPFRTQRPTPLPVHRYRPYEMATPNVFADSVEWMHRNLPRRRGHPQRASPQ